MSEESVFNMIRTAQPQHIKIPANNRFSKLTLSAHKRKNLTSRLPDKAENRMRTNFLDICQDLIGEDNGSQETMPKLQFSATKTNTDDKEPSQKDDSDCSKYLSRRFADMSMRELTTSDDDPLPLGQMQAFSIINSEHKDDMDEVENSEEEEEAERVRTRFARRLAAADTQPMPTEGYDDDFSSANTMKDDGPCIPSFNETISDTQSIPSDSSVVILDTDEGEETDHSSEEQHKPVDKDQDDIRKDRTHPKVVDIAAKISIRIRIPDRTTSESTEGEEEQVEQQNTSESPAEKDQGDYNGDNDAQQRAEAIVQTPCAAPKSEAEAFLSKSRSLLNRLYGRAWQTPEVISNLESPFFTTFKKRNKERQKIPLNCPVSCSDTEGSGGWESSKDYCPSEDSENESDEEDDCYIPTRKGRRDEVKNLNQRFKENMQLLETPISSRARRLKGKQVDAKKQEIGESGEKKYSFLKSLDDCVSKLLCDSEALFYRNHYKSEKENLSQRLYTLYNETVFDGKLNVPIQWNKKLINTAGRCMNKRRQGIRTSVVELSNKVLTSAERLRCTLIHELCHAAAWIFNGGTGHGASWKWWSAKANRILPELPPIKVCHQYDIEYKYTYKCVLCGANSQAHSKSKKVENLRCRYCHGSIEVLLNKRDKDGCVTPTPVRKPSGFAKFVQDNYSKYKGTGERRTHAEVMKLLSKEFASMKVNQEKGIREEF